MENSNNNFYETFTEASSKLSELAESDNQAGKDTALIMIAKHENDKLVMTMNGRGGALIETLANAMTSEDFMRLLRKAMSLYMLGQIKDKLEQ